MGEALGEDERAPACSWATCEDRGPGPDVGFRGSQENLPGWNYTFWLWFDGVM